MKLKGVTRRAVSSMDDNELAKLHSQIHAEDGNVEVNQKQKERQLWEAHNTVSAEMDSRGMNHRTPLGNEDEDSSPASSNPGADSAVNEADTGGALSDTDKAEYECECLECGHTIKSSEHCKVLQCEKCGGKMRRKDRPGVGKSVKMTILGKTLVMSELSDVIYSAFEGSPSWAYVEEVEAIDNQLYVIYCVGAYDDDDFTNMKYYRAPMTVNDDGIEIDFGEKEEVEQKIETNYVEKNDTENVTMIAPLLKGSESDEDRFALFLAYAPDRKDSQNEWASEREVEKAAHDFGIKCYMDKGGHVDMNHEEDSYKCNGVAVVENTILRNGMGKSYDLPDGSWLVGLIFADEDLWQMLKDGEIGGVSIGGRAERRKKAVTEKAAQIKKSGVKKDDMSDEEEYELFNMEIDFMSLVALGANYTQAKGGKTVLLMKSANMIKREKENEGESEVKDLKELKAEKARLAAQLIIVDDELRKLDEGETNTEEGESEVVEPPAEETEESTEEETTEKPQEDPKPENATEGNAELAQLKAKLEALEAEKKKLEEDNKVLTQAVSAAHGTYYGPHADEKEEESE